MNRSRAILEKAGIRINDVENMCFALNWDHWIEYAESVARRLEQAELDALDGVGTLRDNVIEAFDEMKRFFSNGERYRYPL